MFFLRVILLLLLPAWMHAQSGPRATDAQIMQAARKVASVGRVDLYEHRVSVPEALAQLADQAIGKMEALLARRWDTGTFGERASVYVSADTRVSHVLGGYDHRHHPKAVLFLSPNVAQAALSGRNATYAHELAHLLTWQYHSHTLREGFADYLALRLHPGAGVGPSRDGHATSPSVAEGIPELLGTTAAPPNRLLHDQAFRESYYASSYRLVSHLIGMGGMATFLELYAAPDPELAFRHLYSEGRATVVAAALK